MFSFGFCIGGLVFNRYLNADAYAERRHLYGDFQRRAVQIAKNAFFIKNVVHVFPKKLVVVVFGDGTGSFQIAAVDFLLNVADQVAGQQKRVV